MGVARGHQEPTIICLGAIAAQVFCANLPHPGAGWHSEWGWLAQVAKVNETIMKMVHFGYKSLVL